MFLLKQDRKPKTEQERIDELRKMEARPNSTETILAERAKRRAAEKGAHEVPPRPSTGSPMMEGAIKPLASAMAKGIPGGPRKK